MKSHESLPLNTNHEQDHESYEKKNLSPIQKVRRAIESDGFHKLVIALVIIDCLCVASEILLGELEKHLIDVDPCAVKVQRLSEDYHGSVHNGSLYTKHSSTEDHDFDHQTHAIFEMVELILTFATFIILGEDKINLF